MDVFTREVVCANCGDPTRYPASILEQIVQRQSESLPDATYINYACPRCKTLTRSPLAREGRIVLDTDRSKLLADLTVYCVFLRCVQEDCESRVILLAPVKRAVIEQELPMHAQTN